MAALDPTLNDRTATSAVAERADCYRMAAALIKQAGIIKDPEADDVLRLAEFLYGS
jgi:hypothetical protein